MTVERTRPSCDSDGDGDGNVLRRWDNITKPPEDKRLYRGLELKNQMKVLLASDSTTDKSAAALNVHVGYLSDPGELPGLAHFCEHMLFMGTEKYPEENDYQKFLSENGGSSNACTSTDYTMYYFDIMPEHLSKALDMFAQFFISPLFTESTTERELQIINSEHEKNVCSDLWRLDQLNKSTGDPNHPFNKFGTGNKNTLETIPKMKGIEIRKELLKFHSEWYSSNIMSLVIIGKESLDELEKMTIDMFSCIENKKVTLPTWPRHPYSEDYRGLELKTVPIKDIRNFHMSFPMPDCRVLYKSSPLHYLSHLVGHESSGSLLSLLKVKGLCNSLSSSYENGARGFGNFSVHVDLTEYGMNHTDDIVELLFQYINLLKKEGIQKWIFDEYANISAIGFRFKDKEEPRRFAVNHVHDLQTIPMEDVLSAHYHLTEWKPEVIEGFLDLIVPSRIRIAIISKACESVCDQTEIWYGTKYHIEKISQEKLNTWINCGFHNDLKIPLPNSFLPDNLDLVERDAESTEFPSIIYDSPFMRLWYKQDNEYLLPKLSTFFDIVSPIAYIDPLNCCLNALFLVLFQDSLSEYVYDAELAGINYNISNTRSGLLIHLDGFSAKQHVFLECIMDRLMSFKVKPERFEIMKEAHIRSLRNFETQQPYEHSSFYLGMLLAEIAWSKKEYLDVSNSMTVENLQDFIDRFFLKIHVESFIHGNITKSKAMELAAVVEKKLPKNMIPLLPQQLVLTREIQLEKGSNYRYEIEHTVHSSSCALLYLQCGLQSNLTNVMLELLMNLISEPCFNILRTKEQLGYIVFSGVRRSNGIQGIRILVQSDRHPAYLESRIEAFLQHMDEYITNLSAKEFENYRESLIALKLKKPKMLLGRSYIYKGEISSQQYHFDRVNVEVQVLKQINKKQLLDYYREIVDPNSENRQKLCLHIISTAEGGSGNPNTKKIEKPENSEELLPFVEKILKETIVEDVVAFKSGRSLFPLITPYTNIPRKGTLSKL